MFQRVEDQVHDVLIRQPVDNMFSLPPPRYQPLIPQHPQPLRNRRYLVALSLGNFADTGLASSQKRQQPEPRWLSQRPEYPRSPLQRLPTHVHRLTPCAVVFRAAAWVGKVGRRCQSIRHSLAQLFK